MDRLKGKISAILAYRGMVQLGHLTQLTDAIMEVIDQETDISFDAGMERAAEIGNNILPSKLGNTIHGYTCGYNDGWYRYQETIRKELDNV